MVFEFLSREYSGVGGFFSFFPHLANCGSSITVIFSYSVGKRPHVSCLFLSLALYFLLSLVLF